MGRKKQEFLWATVTPVPGDTGDKHTCNYCNVVYSANATRIAQHLVGTKFKAGCANVPARFNVLAQVRKSGLDKDIYQLSNDPNHLLYRQTERERERERERVSEREREKKRICIYL